jgi:hypothetical protein
VETPLPLDSPEVVADLVAWFVSDAAGETPNGDAFELLTGLDVAEPVRSDVERLLERVGALESHIAALQGAQVRAIAEFVALSSAGARESDLEQAELSAYAEVALVLGVAPRTADGRVSDALSLVGRLPATVQALCAGAITMSKARVILSETALLDPSVARRAEVLVLPRAAGLTPGNLRRAVRRVVERIDGEALVKRQAAARADRWVRTREYGDGMSVLEARLPTEHAQAVYGVLDAAAQARGANDDRTVDQRRADALVDLICTSSGRRSRLRHDVRVLVPADLVLGRSGAAPARLASGAAIPDDLATRLLTDNTWRRILTDPATGQALDVSPRRYRPSRALSEYIRTRDQRCRFPNCRQPASRTDLDHTVPFDGGGPTVRSNLAVLCRRHHRVKQLPGWSCSQAPEGVLTFTTPTGRSYRTRPPTAYGTDQPVETV